MAQASFPDGVLPLDELEMLVVIDNETDTLSSVDDGVPQLAEVVHLAARTPPSRKYDGHECKTVFDQLCCACHIDCPKLSATALLIDQSCGVVEMRATGDGAA